MGLPLFVHLNAQTGEQWKAAEYEPQVWTALSTETSLPASHKPTYIYSLYFKACQSGRLQTVITVCLAQL